MERLDDVFERLTVEGRITARGEPLGDAVFRMRVLEAGCQGDPVQTVGPMRAESDGTFRVELGWEDPRTDDPLLACIEIVVSPPSGLGLEIITTVTVDEVRFVRFRPKDGPVDIPTVEIEINVDNAEALNP